MGSYQSQRSVECPEIDVYCEWVRGGGSVRGEYRRGNERPGDWAIDVYCF